MPLWMLWGLGVVALFAAPTGLALVAYKRLEEQRKPHERLARWFDMGMSRPVAGTQRYVHALVLSHGTVVEAARTLTALRPAGPGRFDPVAQVACNQADTLVQMLKAQFADHAVADDLYQVSAEDLLRATEHARFMVPGIEVRVVERVSEIGLPG